MSTIRLTVTVPDDLPPVRQASALADLAGVLHAALEDDERLTRREGLSLPGAPATSGHPGLGAGLGSAMLDLRRVFTLVLPDGHDGTGLMAALNGWFMRHAWAQIALKADGPAGGVSLRLASYSAVGVAGAIARVHDVLLAAEDHAEG